MRGEDLVNQFQERKNVLNIGHRGAAGEAPENTLAAFALALEQGSDALELDVHLSADGEIIVCHDATVNRTTDGTGEIARMTVAELKKLDAGSKFSTAFAGEPLPLLSEVFDLVPAGIMINVEVKCKLTPRLQERLLELLEKYNRIDSVVISSFDHKVLLGLKQADPRVRIGLLYNANFMNHRKVAEAAEVEVYSLHPYFKLLGAEDVVDAREHGLHVYPWTIDNPEHMLQAIQAGVSGIITNYPARLTELLKKADKK